MYSTLTAKGQSARIFTVSEAAEEQFRISPFGKRRDIRSKHPHRKKVNCLRVRRAGLMRIKTEDKKPTVQMLCGRSDFKKIIWI